MSFFVEHERRRILEQIGHKIARDFHDRRIVHFHSPTILESSQHLEIGQLDQDWEVTSQIRWIVQLDKHVVKPCHKLRIIKAR